MKIPFLILSLTAPVLLYAASVQYEYDASGRLTRAKYGNGAQTIAYTYDANGNLLLRQATAGVAPGFTLVYLAGAGGAIQGVATQTVAQGSSGSPVTALTNQFQRFVRWSDGRTDNPRTDTNVTANLQVTAQFAPLLAPGGTPHWWLASFGYTGDLSQAEASDSDKDGHTAAQEYVADTNPTNAASRLRVLRLDKGPPVTVHFEPASSNRLYHLRYATNLASGGWTNVSGPLPKLGNGRQDDLTDTNPVKRAMFYQVAVEAP